MKSLKKLLAFSAIAAIPALASGGALAIPLFSVDSASNDLVRIESTTGAVTVIGALGINAFDMDLTRTADGRLWGLNSQFQNRVDLVEINPLTGAVISSAQVSFGGNNILNGEGLAHDGNQLKIGFSTNGDSFSDNLADLATSGAISTPVFVTVDMDGLAIGVGAIPFYSVDRDPGNNTFVHEIDPGSLPATLIGTFDDSDVRSNDLVRDASDIITIDGFNNELHIFDINTPTTLNSISLNRGGDYRGLAKAGPIGVPEPGSLALVGLGLAGFAYFRRRRGA